MIMLMLAMQYEYECANEYSYSTTLHALCTLITRLAGLKCTLLSNLVRWNEVGRRPAAT